MGLKIEGLTLFSVQSFTTRTIFCLFRSEAAHAYQLTNAESPPKIRTTDEVGKKLDPGGLIKDFFFAGFVKTG